MNSLRSCGGFLLIILRGSVHSVGIGAQIPRTPSVTNGLPRSWLLSVVRCHRPLRDGDGLSRPIYWLGSGLSWNPIAAAFRSSTFNRLSFILASYSSIDWVTYSSPCLSIL